MKIKLERWINGTWRHVGVITHLAEALVIRDTMTEHSGEEFRVVSETPIVETTVHGRIIP